MTGDDRSARELGKVSAAGTAAPYPTLPRADCLARSVGFAQDLLIAEENGEEPSSRGRFAAEPDVPHDNISVEKSRRIEKQLECWRKLAYCGSACSWPGYWPDLVRLNPQSGSEIEGNTEWEGKGEFDSRHGEDNRPVTHLPC